MDPIVAAVHRVLRRERMIPERGRVLAAVSGGSDSVALLAILAELGHAAQAAHFNHGWRGAESDRDETFVRSLCDRLCVPLTVGRAGEVPRAGFEETGRRLRYAFLHQAARDADCARIATGHTRDDQGETVLLRLLRGSGLVGLRGVLAARADGVIRPLLELSRDELRRYLERRGLDFVEDSSNTDRRFSRNRLRAEVMPALTAFSPRASQRLAALAAALTGRVERDRLLSEEMLRRCATGDGGLSAAALEELPGDVRTLVARAWLARTRGHLRGIGTAHLRAVANCNRSGARIVLPGGVAATNEHGTIRLVAALEEAETAQAVLAAPGAVVFADRWHISAAGVENGGEPFVRPANLWEAILDAEKARPPFLVRAWANGDRVRPLGMAGERKLSDVFIDAKIARRQRRFLPIVEAGGRILWVPGVVRSTHGTVSESTRRVLRLTAVPVI